MSRQGSTAISAGSGYYCGHASDRHRTLTLRNRRRGSPHDCRGRRRLRHRQAQGGAPDSGRQQDARRHPARLLHLRQLAVQLMEELARFNPYLTGAVLNGTAGEHSDIHLQLFTSSAKDVEIYLLNKNINFDVSERPHFKSSHKGGHEPVETLSYLLPQRGAAPEGVHLAVYDVDDLRGGIRMPAGKRADRADIDAVRRLIMEES